MEGIGGGLAGAWGPVCPGAADGEPGAELGVQSNGDGGRQGKIAPMCRAWP